MFINFFYSTHFIDLMENIRTKFPCLLQRNNSSIISIHQLMSIYVCGYTRDEKKKKIIYIYERVYIISICVAILSVRTRVYTAYIKFSSFIIFEITYVPYVFIIYSYYYLLSLNIYFFFFLSHVCIIVKYIFLLDTIDFQ